MCNDYEQHNAWDAYVKAMQAAALKVPARQSALDLPQADDVRIGDVAPVVRMEGEEATLIPMRFGFPPQRPGRSPVFNFRSEGRSFADSRRCLIPASAFFEFTGTKYPKAKHRFTLNGAPFLAIAGLWKPGEGNQPDAFTMLTCDPGPDVAPIHNRQMAVLPPEDWRPWLDLSRPEPDLLRPLPAGSLSVETVRGEAA
jgi:putative SOS response-associated peptidase YedK